MEGVPANYQGRIVSKHHFRAFIYKPDGSQKLVNSWDEFECHIASGLWFVTKEDARDAFLISSKEEDERYEALKKQDLLREFISPKPEVERIKKAKKKSRN